MTISATTTTTPEKGAKKWLRLHLDWLPISLIFPTITLMVVFLLYPIFRGIQLSFYDVSLLDRTGGSYVGLQNYIDLFNNPQFWDSLRVTIGYSAGVVAFSYTIGLGTALLLSQQFPCRNILRMLMIIPWAIPEVVDVLI